MEILTLYLKAFGISLVPVLELRGSLIWAAAAGLDPIMSYFVCVIGNLLPVPFLIKFVRPVFELMRSKSRTLGRIVEKLEKKAEDKSAVIKKYEMLGLFILVAIPLPGTGAWTGSLVAAMLDMRIKDSFPMIALGVLAAGVVVTLASFGVTLII